LPVFHGDCLSTQSPIPTESIECPLCLGEGKFKRTALLDRLGVKDFARVAQLSAEEAFRLLLSKHKDDERTVWARFEAELTKRTAEISQRHKDEIHTLTARTKELETAARTTEQQKAHDIEHVNRRVEDSLRQVAELQQRNQELESQMSKVAPVESWKNLALKMRCRPGRACDVREREATQEWRLPIGLP